MKVAADIGSTANSYHIVAKLAVGGMADIFLARGAGVAGVERYCVLKQIRDERATDERFVQMFIEEARLAAQLQHPNIASVYDVGMLGESYFFTMEYVHGQTVLSLRNRALEVGRPLPLACVLTIIAGAAAGLHHAHERLSSDGRSLGIVHRDVSPSNVMVSYEGNVKLVDFGVAKAAGRAVNTRTGTVKGKVSYMSPEQCKGMSVDRRSDLFSLGIVFWEMLTGERLYRRESDFDNMAAIVHELAPLPSTRRADVPREVDAIVARLLAKPLAERFQTAGEVIEAIEHASMRAGTLLSLSAVGRLLRDLFGVHAEPWIDLEGDTARLASAARGSTPIPPIGGHAPDTVEIHVGAVPDVPRPEIARGARSRSLSKPPPVAEPAAAPVPPSGAVTIIRAPIELPTEPASAPPDELPTQRASSPPPVAARASTPMPLVARASSPAAMPQPPLAVRPSSPAAMPPPPLAVRPSSPAAMPPPLLAVRPSSPPAMPPVMAAAGHALPPSPAQHAGLGMAEHHRAGTPSAPIPHRPSAPPARSPAPPLLGSPGYPAADSSSHITAPRDREHRRFGWPTITVIIAALAAGAGAAWCSAPSTAPAVDVQPGSAASTR